MEKSRNGSDDSSGSGRKVTLRSPLPGEWGWIMSQNGSVYWDQYRYNSNFERFVGEIVCEFLRHEHTTKCRAWIADVGVDGKPEPIGCVLCTALDNEPKATVAKLRVLYVAPEARGLGIGTALVAECVKFAKEVGYKKMSLYTHASLTPARKVYDAAGFRLIESESGYKHHTFGPEQEDQFMELDLV